MPPEAKHKNIPGVFLIALFGQYLFCFFTAVLLVGIGLPTSLVHFAGCVDLLHARVPRLVGRRAERKYGLRLATPGLP